ncbi:MAG: hypothetical protein LBK82_02375 [Planctomycetaceae bacterium]|jgi:hypothetical protein|nr:hypothetical protein [Planctomycetaceae bacterium]
MKRTKRPPFIFRLILSLPFLPIFILLAYVIFFAIIESNSPLWNDTTTLVLGVPERWVYLFFVTFPFLLGIWLFRSGQWRLPVFVAGTVYYSFLLLGIAGYLNNYEVPTISEKRIISWDFGWYKGTDVYCNGIYLGQTPLEIRVDELMSKVPEWTSPPEQQWYFENPSIPICYTWLPWDNFRSKERFLETKNLLTSKTSSASSAALLASRKKQAAMYIANCRYWWRFENNKSSLFLSQHSEIQQYQYQTFENTPNYRYNYRLIFLPSPQIQAWLLFNVLGELTESEKNDWDRHVLKHWALLRHPLIQHSLEETTKYRSNNPNDPRIKILETMFDSTARLKYGLSDPPTEEECRILLTTWLNESISNLPQDRKPFSLHSSYSRRPESVVIANDNEQPLIDIAIRLMGKTIQKPLAEQWNKNYYRFEDAWAPVIYLSRTDKDAEYFDHFARYFATTWNGHFELLENQDERVIPLFKTLLYQKTFFDIISNDDTRSKQDQDSINRYSLVTNPLLEPTFFEYMTYALSRPKLSERYRNELNLAVFRTISLRIDREVSNNEESAVRIASLPIPQRFKDVLIQEIQMKSDGIKSFSDLLQQAAGSKMRIKTKKTAEDVNRWFAENPEGTLETFFQAFENDFELNDGIITNDSRENRTMSLNQIKVTNKYGRTIGDTEPLYSSDGQFIGTGIFERCLVSALLKTNTPETQKTIKQICNNFSDLQIVLFVIGGESLQISDDSYTNTNPYFNLIDYSDISIECPDFLFDVLEELKSYEVAVNETSHISLRHELRTLASSILEYCPSPRAGQLLEKWSHTENEKLRQKFTASLKHWQKRKEIQEQKKELFHKLVEEKITPDDLLTPQPPWVWKENGYVQVSE